MANVSFDYVSWFAEGKTAEMFQPQSCKGLTMEEKVLECFDLTLFHTALTTCVCQNF